MKEVITLLAEIVNEIHDMLVYHFGLNMTDKELHFWVVGMIGIMTYFLYMLGLSLYKN